MKKILLSLITAAVFALPAHADNVKVGFSRGSPTAKEVAICAIGDAKTTLRIAAYQFTNIDIVRAVIAAQARGVDVAVILDKTQRNGDTQAALVASGIACNIATGFKIMHHKFMVIDDKHVETVSFNYTTNADKYNAENALYILNTSDLAGKYKAQWDWIKSGAVPCKGGGQ